ncbi:MAG: hypothetical protein QM771_12650 [Nitrospira sp.]
MMTPPEGEVGSSVSYEEKLVIGYVTRKACAMYRGFLNTHVRAEDL